MKKVPPLVETDARYHESINKIAVALGSLCQGGSNCFGRNVACDECMFAGLADGQGTSGTDRERTAEIEKDVTKILELLSKITIPED